MIVALHISGKLGLPDFKEAFPYGSGVSFFYVLSGFILTYVYFKPQSDLKFLKFIKKRFLRLFPLHIATLILMCVLVPSVLMSDWAYLPFQLTMTQSWIGIKDAAYSFNAPAWSISTEMGFYVLFPWFLLLYKRIGSVFFILTASTLLSFVIMDNIAPNLKWFWANIDVHPLTRLMEFVCGIWVAKLYLEAPNKHRSVGVFTFLEILSVSLIVIAGFLTMKIYETPYYPKLGNNIFGVLARSGLFPLFGLLIWVFSYSRGWLSKALSWRPFVFLGEISFAIYLVHQIVIVVLQENPELTLGASNIIIIGSVLGLTLSISIILYFSVEKPMLKIDTIGLKQSASKSILAMKRRNVCLSAIVLAFSLLIPLKMATGIIPSKYHEKLGLGEGAVGVNLKAVDKDVILRAYKFEEFDGRQACLEILWEIGPNSSEDPLSSRVKLHNLKSSDLKLKNSMLLVPKKLKASDYPIKLVDKTCFRRNFGTYSLEIAIKSKLGGPIKFPYKHNVRPAVWFEKKNGLRLANLKK